MKICSKVHLHITTIKDFIWSLYIAQYDPCPYLALILLYLSALDILPIYNYTFIILINSLIGYFIMKRSYFFFYGIGINKIGFNWLISINMLIGLFSCNEKWKIYIFTFVLGDFISGGQGQQFKTLMCLVICAQILINFSFKKKDNLIFFTVFLSLACTFCQKRVISNINVSALYLVLLIPIKLKVFGQIFQYLQKNLLNKKKIQISKPQTAFYYIWATAKRFKQAQYRYYLIQQHRRQCFDPSCFCYSLEKNKSDKPFEDHLYKQFIRGFDIRKTQAQFLFNKYIEFKTQDKKYFQAIILNKLLNPQTSNIFRKVERSRNQQRLKQGLRTHQVIKFQSMITLQVLEYDFHYRKIKQMIIEILQQKMKFFIELGKPVTKLTTLSSIGRKIVVQMQSLHEFFQRKILPIQQKINSFIILVLYLKYLSTTTNFKQEVEFLLRNAQRKIKQIRLSEQSSKQVLTMLLEVKRQSNRNKFENYICEANDDESYQILFKKVSTSFYQFINLNQSQIIGKNINMLIPQVYNEIHQQLVKDTFKDLNIRDNSKLNGQNKPIPIKMKDNGGKIVNMSIKILLNHNMKLQFICLVNLPNKLSNLIITNFEGKLHYCQTGINSQILSHQIIKQKLIQKKRQWHHNKQLTQQNFIINFQESKYFVKISYSQEKQSSPLIYLQFQEEIGSKNNNMDSKGFEEIDACIHGFMIEAQRDDQQSMQNKTQNKMNSCNNIIANYIDKKVFRFFYSYLIPLIVTCIILVIFSILLLKLYSSNSVNNTINLIDDFQLSVEIQEKINQGLLLYNNLKWLNKGFINNTYMQKVYGKVNFEEYVGIRFSLAYQDLQHTVYQKFNGNIDQQIGNIVRQIMNQKIVLHSSNSSQSLSMSTNNILVNCILDFNLITKKISTMETIEKYFLHNLRPKLIQIRLKLLDYFKDQRQTRIIANIIILILFLIVLVILMIPFYLFKKKYSKYRLNIYDLLASIQTNLLQCQLKKLNSLVNDFKPKFKQKKNNLKELQHEVNIQGNDILLTEGISTQNDLLSSKKQEIINFKEELRKRSGQIDLVGSQQEHCKIVWKKYMLILLILLVIPMFITTISIKIKLQNELYEIVDKINMQHYLYRIAEDSTAMFNQLYSKRLQNKKITKMDMSMHFKQGLDGIIQFAKLKNQRIFDNKNYMCIPELRNQLICQHPFIYRYQ